MLKNEIDVFVDCIRVVCMSNRAFHVFKTTFLPSATFTEFDR
jgi:hypothetical protein